MIRTDEIAVCFSGVSGDESDWVIQRVKNQLPYDTFFATWQGKKVPKGAANCHFFPEPKYDYHNLLETKIKPNCEKWRRSATPPAPGRKGGTWHKKENYEKVSTNSKQILCHFYLLNTLPKKYKLIVKIRYDLMLTSKISFDKYLQKAQEGIVIGFAGSLVGAGGPSCKFNEHKIGCDCGKCGDWVLFDHMIFHARHKMHDGVERLFLEKNLLGAEWGWHQVLCDWWGGTCKDYIRVEGGTQLVRDALWNRDNWEKF